jgi:thiol-disulfide isomerase/thioredoxin
MRLLPLSLLPFAFALAVEAAPPAPPTPTPNPPAVVTEAKPTEAKPTEAKPLAPAEKPVLLGNLTREQIEAAVPDWVQAEIEALPEKTAIAALAAVPPGAEVTVYMGSWCPDSRREVSRLWRVLDESGGSLPCKISYIGVDHDKKEPVAMVAGSGLLYVPTFIVKRDGREVGRIVESSPHGVEQDLLALLSGSAHGLVTAKPELLDGKKP